MSLRLLRALAEKSPSPATGRHKVTVRDPVRSQFDVAVDAFGQSLREREAHWLTEGLDVELEFEDEVGHVFKLFTSGTPQVRPARPGPHPPSSFWSAVSNLAPETAMANPRLAWARARREAQKRNWKVI